MSHDHKPCDKAVYKVASIVVDRWTRCRNGALVSIPDANNDAVVGDGEALIDAAWQAFLFARTATIASVTRAEQDAEKAKASA